MGQDADDDPDDQPGDDCVEHGTRGGAGIGPAAGGLALPRYVRGRRSGTGGVRGHCPAFLEVAWVVGGELVSDALSRIVLSARALGPHVRGRRRPSPGRPVAVRGEGAAIGAAHARCCGGLRRLTPGYTARMGHWDFLVDHFANRLPAGADRSTLLAAAQAAGAEIEMLAGQSFGPLKRHSVSTDTFGMPFVEVP